MTLQLENDPPAEPEAAVPAADRGGLRPLLWRLHFLGGFLAAPGPDRPLREQVAAARETHPEWTVTTVVPAAEGGEQITASTCGGPATADGEAWTVARQESRWPVELTTVAVDPASGVVADRVSWVDYPLLAKATTLGVAFHQAELFGLAIRSG